MSMTPVATSKFIGDDCLLVRVRVTSAERNVNEFVEKFRQLDIIETIVKF